MSAAAPAVELRTERTIRVGAARYPLVLPNPRDARLHVALVIITIHVLGQTVLDFRVSAPQILAAIGTCFAIEVLWTFSRHRRVVWPASAMLTGSGVALILRLRDMPANHPWSFHGWYVFSLVAAGSLATKYVIRRNGAHVFNPSNVGLVVAFLALGRDRIEPLDFWWKPFGLAMLLVYAVIVGGGMTIAWRARMASMPIAFWCTLAFGLAVLARAGHMMISPTSAEPMSGFVYWKVVMGSPETLIFSLFMVTDPRTIPSSTRARVLYAMAVGALCSLLMAPQTTEWDTKVALLGGLACCSAARGLVLLVRDRATARGTATKLRTARRPAVAALALLAPIALALGVTAAGAGARTISSALIGLPEPSSDARAVAKPRVRDLPTVQLTKGAVALDPAAARESQELARSIGWMLAVEDRAYATADPTLLASVDYGRRLADLKRELRQAVSDGETIRRTYRFDEMKLIVVRGHGEATPLLGMHVVGHLTERRTIDGDTARSRGIFDRVIVVRRAGPTGWRIVDEVSPPFKMGRFPQ